MTVAADVYGLGATRYAILTGRPPHPGDSLAETLRKVLEEEPARPRAIDSGADRDLEAICLKCLERDPRRRYPSAEALAEDLERRRDGLPIAARTPTAWTHLDRWRRRRPALAAMLALIVVGTLASLAVVTRLWLDSVAARAALEEEAYADRIALADREIAAGRVGRAEELLEECPDRLRGWEWHHLTRRGEAQTLPRQGPPSMIAVLAYSPDGRWLASVGEDGCLIVRDSRAGAVRFSARDPGLVPASSVAYREDGRSLLVGTSGGDLIERDATTGAETSRRPLHVRAIRRIAPSPDGLRVATAGDDRTVRILDATSLRELLSLEGASRSIRAVAFSPDGLRLASGGLDGQVVLRDGAPCRRPWTGSRGSSGATRGRSRPWPSGPGARWRRPRPTARRGSGTRRPGGPSARSGRVPGR